MSDKELDQLFQQKFGNFEPTVSPDLWSRINSELGSEKEEVRVRKFPIRWMAAASVAILLFCGIWVVRDGAVQGTKTAKAPVQKMGPASGNRPRVIARQTEPARPVQGTNAAAATVTELSEPIVENKIARQLPTAPVRSHEKHPASEEPQVQAPVLHNAAVVAATQAVPPATTNTDVPASHDPLKGVTVNSMISTSKKVDPSVMASLDNSLQADEQPKTKIRSIGGLVNYVVGKVDKRDEKLIEFKDSEEGSVVSGINLGLLKFKGKNHKDHTNNQ